MLIIDWVMDKLGYTKKVTLADLLVSWQFEEEKPKRKPAVKKPAKKTATKKTVRKKV